MMSRGTEVSDYLPFLADLSANNKQYFLEGGQAVNFWAEYLSAKGRCEGISDFKPFTSKDCDIWIDLSTLNYLGTKKNGHLLKGKSPADGQVGIFTTNESPARIIDLMIGVYGIPARHHKRLLMRTLQLHGIRVLDPLLLFKSKSHCLVELNQTGRQDEKHLRMLCLILPEYILELLDVTQAGNLTQRDFINEIKFLQKICEDRRVETALKTVNVTPAKLIPVDKLTSSNLSKLKRFSQSISDSKHN